MIRKLAILVLSFASLAPAIAETYNDPEGRFSVTRPQGWTEDTHIFRGEGTFAFIREKSNASPYSSSCTGSYHATPATRSQSQEDVNGQFDSRLTEDSWRQAFASIDPDITVTINETSHRSVSGRRIQSVIFTATEVDGDKTDSVKAKTETHLVPGSVHWILCATAEEHFPAASADFDVVFTSYTPHPNAAVSRLKRPAPSVLTMFAAARFKGAARVLSQSTANLAAAGLPTTSASLVVDGDEPWQVCTGANYSGRCEVMLTADAGASGRPIVIGSARRLTGNPELLTATATTLRRMMRQPAVRRLFVR